jgi:Lon protease-like protein
MAREAISGRRRIGMVAVRPEHVSEMVGDPPVFAVGCEGEIEHCEKLADGRFNLTLLGLQRFRIVDETPPTEARLYRLARVESLPEPSSQAERERAAAHRSETLALLGRLLERAAPGRAAAVVGERFREVSDDVLTNALAQAIDFEPAEKQALLEANGVAERSEQLLALLRFRVAEWEASGPGGSQPVH